MKLLSVNVATLQNFTHAGNEVATGIYKLPRTSRVKVSSLGLEGDHQADLVNHGGIHKAVYSYPAEHYEFWSRELARADLSWGAFGENLTITGFSEDNVFIGDVFKIGTALLEVTQPRVPCFKLAHKLNVPDLVPRFTQSWRTGFYHKVIQEGEVAAGDSVERVRVDPNRVSVREMMRIMQVDRDDVAGAEKALKLGALTPSWREKLQQRVTGGAS